MCVVVAVVMHLTTHVNSDSNKNHNGNSDRAWSFINTGKKFLFHYFLFTCLAQHLPAARSPSLCRSLHTPATWPPLLLLICCCRTHVLFFFLVPAFFCCYSLLRFNCCFFCHIFVRAKKKNVFINNFVALLICCCCRWKKNVSRCQANFWFFSGIFCCSAITLFGVRGRGHW